MDKVAVVRSWFLPISETFIYSELVSLNNFTPIVCYKRRMNPEQFPFDSMFQFKTDEELKEILSEQKVDLIHARFGLTGAELLNVKKELGIPMLTSFHGFDLPTNVRTFDKYGGRLERLFQEGDAFTVTSNNMKKILVDFGCPENKIFVHHSGIDIEKFSFRTRKFPKHGVITILSVGRLVEKKGMKYLIKAFSKVHKKYPRTRLRIAGDGELRDELKAQVKQLKLKKAVTFLGGIPQEEVIKEMQKAHLFALTSKTASDGNQEGIPNVLKEAMASGLPVVSTRHAGIPELVRDGKSGFLVKERDTSAIARSLIQLMKHPDRWNKMGENGRKTVKQFFNTQKQIVELEQIYQTVINGQNSQGKEQSDD
ncbi:colanic acid biosynthesis glycosyltransferase WcaL [Sporolactobacillus sp. THM7-4]|nr:colanic acid biosynthesis glycosyltransferase WcaL [Sporolactobacillus sp. THM7-4]